MCNINHPIFPCRICAKSVHEKDAAAQSDLCEISIHIKCNKLNHIWVWVGGQGVGLTL